MATVSPDPAQKANEAAAQLCTAMLSAAQALQAIAEVVPTLFPGPEIHSDWKRTASADPEAVHAVNGLPTSKKRKRTVKDPDAPEKPPSAYHLFYKENKNDIKTSMSSDTPSNEV